MLLKSDPILTLNLHIHHGSVGLEASCQHNHVCRNDAVRSLNALWNNPSNLRICEEELFVVERLEVAAVENTTLNSQY